MDTPLESEDRVTTLQVVEICAGAGGQAIGLHRAGFHHALAVEIDGFASQTLRNNTNWPVAEGDVADPEVWSPEDYRGVDLLAGGVPCPPFSIAGKQLGSSDERDLFAWAVEQVAVIRPRALMLENVRGLAAARFSAYRQRVLDRLAEFGYVADWRLLHASDFGVPQLRPRFVLVAMSPEDAAFFRWPDANQQRVTVGVALRDLMGANGWPHVNDWVQMANTVGPTLVGGSKKHGGADLGPTRAKRAWAAIGVNGHGVADSAPGPDDPHPSIAAPKLTVEMVARLQGWSDELEWTLAGRKTAQYRQIGNAFPPPVAEAVGSAIRDALDHVGQPHAVPTLRADTHDIVYKTLADAEDFVAAAHLEDLVGASNPVTLEQRIAALSRDFDLQTELRDGGNAYRLGAFKGFIGQLEHERHSYMANHKSRIS